MRNDSHGLYKRGPVHSRCSATSVVITPLSSGERSRWQLIGSADARPGRTIIMLLHCPSSFNVSALDPGIIPAGPDAVEIVSWPPQEFCVESWRTEWFDRLDIWAVSLLKSGALDGMWDGTHRSRSKCERRGHHCPRATCSCKSATTQKGEPSLAKGVSKCGGRITAHG